MHILIDLDGTLADWGGRWDEVLENVYSDYTNIPRHSQQTSFNLKLGLTEEEQRIVDLIFDMEHFYDGLDPIPGAVEAYHEMVRAGHWVQIVTSPWWSNPNCLQNKSDWVRNNLGVQAQQNIVFTSDKTAQIGDVLFDDKPEITGKVAKPFWEQIIYSQPYNMTVPKPRIHSWDEWEEAVTAVVA